MPLDKLKHRLREFPPDEWRRGGSFDFKSSLSRPEDNWDMGANYRQPDWVMQAHNTAKVKQIFLFGTGPSLGGQLPLLQEMSKQHKHTWTVNRMRTFKALPFTPLFHSIAEPAPVEAWGRGIYPLYDFPEAVNRIAVHWYPVYAPGWTWVAKAQDEQQIRWHGFFGLGDVFPPLPSGWASPLTVAQVAAWMGYQEFYFLGVDTTQKGQAWDAVQGRTARERNILAILECFDRARAQIQKAGRKVFDCTPGGRLNREGVLPYAELSDILAVKGD